VKMRPYELLDVVGKGAMATVYRGRHTRTGQIVAVKLLAPDVAADPVLLRRFERECKAACRLRHPHLVRGLDYGVDAGQPYVVLEFVDGLTLGQHIKRAGKLAEDHGVRLALQVAEALELAHRENLVHRDVKPDNILLTADGQAKLTDLGLLKVLDGEAGMTRSRTSLGTVAFMAPEQFGDACRVDRRSDVYGLGATLYYVLAGAVPFPARGNLTVLRKKLKNELLPPRQLVPSLGIHVDKAICRALDAVPARRPSSCAEFADLLVGRGAPSSSAVRSSPAAPKLRPRPEDRRTASRYPSALNATCKLVGGGPAWAAEVEDLSLKGVRLQLGHRFERGAVLRVVVHGGPPEAAPRRLVRVCWVRQVASERWSLGCMFSRQLTSEELGGLLENQEPTVLLRPGS
jgi:serine/threonine protein kinase